MISRESPIARSSAKWPGCTRRHGFSRIARCAIPSAPDPRGDLDGEFSQDSAEYCSRRKQYSRQGDARDERGLGRMESKPTGKAGGTVTKRTVVSSTRSA